MNTRPITPTVGRRGILAAAGMAGVATVIPMSVAHAVEPDATGTVRTSQYGFDPADATAALQAALDSTARYVVIDNVGAEWLTRPLSVNRDDVTILLEPGVKLRAKPGGFNGAGDCLLNIKNRSRISLIGYGAEIAMNKAEYIAIGDKSQWRHVLNVYSSNDVLIEGVTLSGAGGDGIYLGRDRAEGRQTYCQDVVIRNVLCRDNFRNGLSVISAHRLLVEHSAFVDTVGQNPQAGIDLEPNTPVEQLTDIVIRDCHLDGNGRGALVLALRLLAGTTTPLSIRLERLYLGRIHAEGVLNRMNFAPTVLYAGALNGAGGTVELVDSYLHVAPYSCALAVHPKDAFGESLALQRNVSVNLGNLSGHYEHISLLGATNPDFGGIEWQDCLEVSDQTTPLVDAHVFDPYPATIRGLRGSMTAVNPHGAPLDLGPKTDDIALAVRHLTAVPPAMVQVRAVSHAVRRGDPIELIFSRQTSDTSLPLAVIFQGSGEAMERLDYAGTAGMVVIPPGKSSVRVTIPTRDRGALFPLESRSRPVTFMIQPNPTYGIADKAEATVAILPAG